MPHYNDLKRLIRKNSRRLSKLKEQQAVLGIHTPVGILIEIEDIEENLKKLQIELEILKEQERNISSSSQLISPTVPHIFSRKYALPVLFLIFLFVTLLYFSQPTRNYLISQTNDIFSDPDETLPIISMDFLKISFTLLYYA